LFLKGAKKVVFDFKCDEPKYDFSVLRMRKGFIGRVALRMRF
jgi:hypothetical protein